LYTPRNIIQVRVPLVASGLNEFHAGLYRLKSSSGVCCRLLKNTSDFYFCRRCRLVVHARTQHSILIYVYAIISIRNEWSVWNFVLLLLFCYPFVHYFIISLRRRRKEKECATYIYDYNFFLIILLFNVFILVYSWSHIG
jgi:hypothetical protein